MSLETEDEIRAHVLRRAEELDRRADELNRKMGLGEYNAVNERTLRGLIMDYRIRATQLRVQADIRRAVTG